MKICISVGGVVMIWTHKIAWDPKKAQESYTVGWLEWHGLPTTGHLAQGRSSMRPGEVDLTPKPFDAAQQMTTIH